MAVVDEGVWGTKVDGVSALERELARLRRSSGAHAKEHGVSIARASVLNLVVFATREAHARPGHVRHGVTDFNWTRITPWRELVMQFFDVPAGRPFLDRITGIRVGFAVDADGREIHPSQALLFVGWLASRLGWTAVERIAPSEEGGLLFSMKRADGVVIPVRVRPRFIRGLEEGDLSGLRIQSEQRTQHAEFVVKR